MEKIEESHIGYNFYSSLRVPVVDKADLYRAVASELWSVVDPTHAAHRYVPPDVELLLEDISNLVDRETVGL